MTGASYCGNPVGTGTTECETPLLGRYVFFLANEAHNNVVNLKEVLVFGSINLSKTAMIVKSLVDSNTAHLSADNLLKYYNCRTTDMTIWSYDEDANYRTGEYLAYVFTPASLTNA